MQFTFRNPTKIIFGVGEFAKLGEEAAAVGKHAMLVTGKSSARKLGFTDRAMQMLYLFAVDPIAETTGDRNSYGFRRERSTADAIQQCFTVLSRKDSAQWIFEGDIAACFDDCLGKSEQRYSRVV